ncbi:MAG: hypothetical protein Q9159_004981 [Coniocarpon cinnabarinum]
MPQSNLTVLFNFKKAQAALKIRLEPSKGHTMFTAFNTRFLLEKKNHQSVMQLNYARKEVKVYKISCLRLHRTKIMQLIEHMRANDASFYRAYTKVRGIDYKNGYVEWAKASLQLSRSIRFLSPEWKQFCASSGIPYRTGLLFSSKPGTSKSSFAYALAEPLEK